MRYFNVLRKWTLTFAMLMGFLSVAHAQASGCIAVDRTLKGQQAWRMVLRYGTPEQLSMLVNQSCIDPNVGGDMNLPSTLAFVANRTMLNQAIALGWRPVDELSRDMGANPNYINPLIRRMIDLPQNQPTQAMQGLSQLLAQRYHLDIQLQDNRSDSEEEDTLLAIADLLPNAYLSTISPQVGVNVLTVAAAGKHDRLVQSLLARKINWTSTYIPYAKGSTRGMWDVTMDPNTCVQQARALIPGGALSGKALEQKQLSIMTALQHSGLNALSVGTNSAVVPSLSLNMATQEALWFSADTWSVARQLLPTDQAYVSEGTANDIRALQKRLGRPTTYEALLGPSLPPSVCAAVISGG